MSVLISSRNENAPLAGRIKQQIERLTQTRQDIFDETTRKRILTDTSDGTDGAKRQRLDGEANAPPSFPPMPPLPITVAQLYTLTSDENLKAFNVATLPADILARITVPLLHHIEQEQLGHAINAIRSRWLSLPRYQAPQPQPHSSQMLNQSPDEDEDEYEPDYEPMEDTEQVINAMDSVPKEDVPATPVNLSLAPFKLPPPPALTEEEARQLGKGTISRVFSMISSLDETPRASKPGLNRVAGNQHNKDSWVTVITRLATRAYAGLENSDDIDAHHLSNSHEGVVAKAGDLSLADGIRETLWKFIIEDFRIRIPIAISWLNEEWYNDRMISMKNTDELIGRDTHKPQHYKRWLLRVLDGIIPYIDAKDKILIRFLSEIPEVDETVLDRVKNMAKDPDRVSLAVNTLQ